MKKQLNQKKLKISKQSKKIVLTFLTVLLLVNIGLIISEMMKEKTTEENQIVSSFSNTPDTTYQVYLKDNILFSDKVQPEDIGYFSTLIDHIEVTFHNKYQGGNGAEYQGDYDITGEITGWEIEPEEPVPAWTKKFVISSKKTFRTTDEELILSPSANIDYNHFNGFIAQVGEVTGYNTAYTMKVTMTVNYTITTAEGEVTGSLQPSVLIPLGESYFKIVEAGNEEMKNEITKTVEVQAPVDYFKISLFLSISLLCLILLILIISSVEPTLTDMQRKRIGKLFKSHGKRIVAVNDNLVNEALSICRVHSMNDMIKISDEIERPILYVFQDDLAAIKEFFIIEREKAYLYMLPDCQPAEMKKKDPEKAEASAESVDGKTAVTA